jgi:hypothetical protein
VLHDSRYLLATGSIPVAGTFGGGKVKKGYIDSITLSGLSIRDRRRGERRQT